jgi:hypothetical protein
VARERDVKIIEGWAEKGEKLQGNKTGEKR